MVQIPLVIALGVRGNIIGLCVGKGYERLKTFHKIVGRVCFLSSGLHTAFWSKSPSIPSCIKTDGQPRNGSGWATLVYTLPRLLSFGRGSHGRDLS
jgi:hypothetical protein